MSILTDYQNIEKENCRKYGALCTLKKRIEGAYDYDTSAVAVTETSTSVWVRIFSDKVDKTEPYVAQERKKARMANEGTAPEEGDSLETPLGTFYVRGLSIKATGAVVIAYTFDLSKE